MNPAATNAGAATAGNAGLVLDQWCEGFAQVLESMAGERPAVSWKPAGPAPADAGLLWWEQPFQGGAELTAWAGAPSETWEHVANRTLRAAGLEEAEPDESRNTWLEILNQSFGALARSAGSALNAEVTCAPGRSSPPGAAECEWISVSVEFPDASLPPLSVGFRPNLESVLPDGPPADVAASEAGEQEQAAPAPRRPRTMDILLDVDLPVSISFGKTQIPLKDVLKLTTGSIIELNRGVDDPVEVLVNHCLLARGEVVVVDGNYGVRIQEIASRQDRLRSLR
jgi:flagellar motor switch protein FliN/FliY